MSLQIPNSTLMARINAGSKWGQVLTWRFRISFICVALILGILLSVGCSNEELVIQVPEPARPVNRSEVSSTQSNASRVAAYSGAESSVSNRPSDGIMVTGTSSISTEPDLVLLNLRVEAFSNSVRKARSTAAKSMDSLMTALKEKGIKEADIKTTRFNIYPRYEYQESIVNGRSIGKQVLTGYVLNNEIAVKVRDIDSIGEIIDSAAEAGGDDIRINHIDFTLDDTSAYMSTLREQAFSDAVTKAKHYADLADVSLGPLISLSEIGAPSIRSAGAMDFGMRSMAMAESSPISSGLLDVSLTVSIVFSVNY